MQNFSYDDFKKITTKHITSLYSETHKFTSYKNISIALAINEISMKGDWFQFGVYKGHTAKILESLVLPPNRLHLFDSFEGLPEAWLNTPFGEGAFFVGDENIPKFNPESTVIHKGWFSDSIPTFLQEYNNAIPFIHLDADLYSSTLDVLNGLNHLIVSGTVLLFDEFFLPSEKGLSDDECRAFLEWSNINNRKFQILWRTEWVQCAIRILR